MNGEEITSSCLLCSKSLVWHGAPASDYCSTWCRQGRQWLAAHSMGSGSEVPDDEEDDCVYLLVVAGAKAVTTNSIRTRARSTTLKTCGLPAGQSASATAHAATITVSPSRNADQGLMAGLCSSSACGPRQSPWRPVAVPQQPGVLGAAHAHRRDLHHVRKHALRSPLAALLEDLLLELHVLLANNAQAIVR